MIFEKGESGEYADACYATYCEQYAENNVN